MQLTLQKNVVMAQKSAEEAEKTRTQQEQQIKRVKDNLKPEVGWGLCSQHTTCHVHFLAASQQVQWLAWAAPTKPHCSGYWLALAWPLLLDTASCGEGNLHGLRSLHAAQAAPCLMWLACSKKPLATPLNNSQNGSKAAHQSEPV